jgi:hypothetical protein
MKNLSIFILTALIVVSCKSENRGQANPQILANGRDTTITFSNVEPSKLPPGWAAETGTWATALENSNSVLKMSESDGSDFNIALLKSIKYVNAEIEVKIKALLGEEDQGGGLVWRYVNSKNYYIVRLNPLEDNIRVYEVVNGKRKQLQTEDTSVKTAEWFTLKVKAQGDRIECYLNDKMILSGVDDTFPNPGLVGFWSKADAVSLFDDLKIKVLK